MIRLVGLKECMSCTDQTLDLITESERQKKMMRDERRDVKQ
jgi:hypothetical protein